MSDQKFKELLRDTRPVDLRVLLIHTAESEMLSNEPVIPTGIAILAAICKQRNVFVRCLDYSVMPYREKELSEIIKREEINVVGISSTTPGIGQAYRIVKTVKETDPNILVLAGGPHPTVLPDEALGKGVDIVVRNEGELTFLELLPLLGRHTPASITDALAEQKGIAYRDRGGAVIVTTPQERIGDLDLIPFPDRDSFAFPEKYHMAIRIKRGNSFSVIGSRGCSEHCFFCSRAVFGNAVTSRSAENIVDEICLVKDSYPDITQFEFLDDYLLLDLDRMARICDLLRERKTGLRWSAGNTRVDNIDPGVLKKMKESGCFKINFGIEAGTDEILRSINKRITIEQARRAISLAKEAGLFVGVYFILGHHRESPDDIRATIRLARTLPADAVQFTLNTPWPGTALYRYLEKQGWLLSKNWDDYRYFSHPVFRTDRLTSKFLDGMLKRAYLSYYTNPRLYLHHIKNLAATRSFFLYFSTLFLILSNLFRGGRRQLRGEIPERCV